MGAQSKKRVIDRVTLARGKRGDFSPVQGDHYHTFYEVLYLHSGTCRFLLKDTVYDLSKGDFVFIAPGELHHSNYEKGTSCEIVMVYFHEQYVEQGMFQKWLTSGKGISLNSFRGSIPALYQEDFEGLLNRMWSENTQIDEYSNAYLAGYLQEFLLFLMRHSVMNEEEPEMLNAKDADILLATKYIYNNFTKPLTLEEVSAIASLSPTYFSKKFKQVTGMGFKEYLNFVRLKHAQAALLTTTNTITDIALEYGFNDSNYFKDLFKKVYGKSPREFRKNPN